MKKVFYFLAAIIALGCLSKVRSLDDESIESNDPLARHIRTFERQYQDHLGVKRYRLMDYSKLKSLLDEIGVIQKYQTRFLDGEFGSEILCSVCRVAVSFLKIGGGPIGTLIDVMSELNTYYLRLAPGFWIKIAELFKPVVVYILEHSSIFDAKYVCSILLQRKNCYYSHPALTWRIDIPDRDPSLESKILKSSKNQSTPLKILHLTDLHISHDYEIGADTTCGYPLCCLKGIGNPNPIEVAGQWGDYRCDIPPWLFPDTLNFIKNTHKDIELIYLTGDIIDHKLWKDCKEDNVEDFAFTFDKLAEYFPNHPVLSVIGNHEPVPINCFAPPDISDEKMSQNWLYEEFADHWSKWLPQEAIATVRKQGYYSILARPKLRIIALNNNVCYNLNFWLLYDTNFLREQLEFLKNELTYAEINGEYVHILAHIFPGEKECIEPWEVNYNLLVTRFAHIIKGQFYGHTHTDGLKIFYSTINGKPINVGYNGASLTTHLNYNPNYKIISVDPNTFDVLDIESYYFNLTEANKFPYRTPRYKRLYSMKESWFDSLSPENFDWLANALPHDDYLFDQYWRFFVREGDASLREGCNYKCRDKTISSITRTVSLTAQSIN